MKKILFLMLSVTAITLNSQVYPLYFDDKLGGSDLEDLDNWFVTLKAGYNQGVSPIISNQDKLYYPNYAGSDQSLSVEIDSSNGNIDDTRRLTTGWITERIFVLKKKEQLVVL